VRSEKFRVQTASKLDFATAISANLTQLDGAELMFYNECDDRRIGHRIQIAGFNHD
jgi:hypothetical protein